MHTVHAGYSVIAPLKPDRVVEASALLRQFRAQPSRLPFSESRTTHFATGVVLPTQRYGDAELPATLMLATSFVGPAGTHLDELVQVGGDGLRELFEHCIGFPEQRPCSDDALKRFLTSHRRADTFYSGMQHVTHEDVGRELLLRASIQQFLDDQQRLGTLAAGAHDVRRQIQDFVMIREDLAWARIPWRRSLADWRALHGRAVLAVAPLLALVIASVAAVFAGNSILTTAVAIGWTLVGATLLSLGALVLAVKGEEKLQRFVAERPPDDRARAIAATQNQPVINEMTVVGPLKEGRWRPLFLRIALGIVALYAPHITIPIVATARWLTIDGGRRLIFISNFTNLSEPYVRDFIDVHNGAKRINLLFGFGRGYPVTNWIISRGALEDPNAFIHVVTLGQQLTELWYCPYHNLSIDNININRRIRQGLFAKLSDKQTREWLQLL